MRKYSHMEYDVIVIGGGPAAAAAGVYVARKQMKAVVITESIGGQSIVSADIQNWIGTPSISGYDLAKNLEAHLRAQPNLEIRMPERVVKVEKDGGEFLVETDKGKTYKSRSVIVASGARRRRLNVPGEDKFEGTGVAYCSTCDAPIFSGMDVAVVGGGNAGLEAAIDLIPFAKSITLVEYGDAPKGDPITLEKLKADKKVSIVTNAKTARIEGDKMVSALIYTDTKTNKEKSLAVQGVFVEIGSIPNSEIVKGLVDINPHGEIVIDHRTCATSCPGVFSAGDVTDELYKQNNISCGDAVKAALSAYNYLLSLKKESPAAIPKTQH